MTIQLIIDNVEIPVEHIRFSDGSSNLKIYPPQGFTPKNYISITVDPTTPVDNYLWEIALIISSLVHTFNGDDLTDCKLICNIPYLPHGRADRIFERGNAFPLETFFGGSYSMFTNRIEILLTDPHSNYYEEWRDCFDFSVKHQSDCFLEIVEDIESGDVLVSPDKGAINKAALLHHKLHNKGIANFFVQAEKKRDLSTGRIIDTVLPDSINYEGKRCIIIDDILDAGGTFIPLAEKLKQAGASRVELYVTHGIFAKGLNLFKGIIDKFHVYGIVGTFVTMQDINNFNQGKETK